jgi:hypothetical protein
MLTAMLTLICAGRLCFNFKEQSDQTSPGPGSNPGLATIMKKGEKINFL